MLNQQLEFEITPDLGNRERITLGHPVNRSCMAPGEMATTVSDHYRPGSSSDHSNLSKPGADRAQNPEAIHISAILPSVLRNIKERQINQ